MAEYYSDDEDEEDEDGVEGGSAQGVGGCEGQVCQSFSECIAVMIKGGIQVVRTIVRSVPKMRQPMTFFLILGSLFCNKRDFASSLCAPLLLVRRCCVFDRRSPISISTGD